MGYPVAIVVCKRQPLLNKKRGTKRREYQNNWYSLLLNRNLDTYDYLVRIMCCQGWRVRVC